MHESLALLNEVVVLSLDVGELSLLGFDRSGLKRLLAVADLAVE